VTLTLRARLAVIATIVSGLLIGGLSIVSYNVLARWLDEDVSTRLKELTDGLHGYLRFDGGVPSVEYNTNDTDQASFVHEATRYYQIYDSATGDLLAFLDEHAVTGKQLRQFGGRLTLIVARENLHEESKLRAALSARFGEAIRVIDALGAVSAIGAGINATFENVRRGRCTRSSDGSRSARSLWDRAARMSFLYYRLFPRLRARARVTSPSRLRPGMWQTMLEGKPV